MLLTALIEHDADDHDHDADDTADADAAYDHHVDHDADDLGLGEFNGAV